MNRVHTILHLGGDVNRLITTAAVGRAYPDARVILSSEAGSDRDHAMTLVALGVAARRVGANRDAWDTVSNFSETWKLVRAMGTTDLHVVTGSRHMPRARVIAREIYWRRGVRLHFWPHSPDLSTNRESRLMIVGDALRAVVARLTGITLANPWLKARALKRIRGGA